MSTTATGPRETSRDTPPGRTSPDRPFRNIFRFFDGEKERGIDPLLVARRIASHPTFNPEVHWAGIKMDPPDMESVGIVVDAVRDVFEVQGWHEVDGQEVGLTEDECIGLFGQFLIYTDSLKKNIEPNPTGPPATAPPVCPPPIQNSNTNDSSGSG